MIAELYLIAPADADPDGFAARLRELLASPTGVAALLLPRGQRGDVDYRAFVSAIAPIAQEAGAAVLIEGEPALVRPLGADGLHVNGSAAAVRAALGALKPDFIVGAGGIVSRHEAMQLGELGIDYIMFGPLSGPIDSDARELAGWWAETMEVPSVLSDPEATIDTADAQGCEFLALSASLWASPDPAAFLSAVAARLETTA